MGDTVSGKFMNLKALLAVDSFLTPGGCTASTMDAVVISDMGENDGSCVSVAEFSMFCVSF